MAIGELIGLIGWLAAIAALVVNYRKNSNDVTDRNIQALKERVRLLEEENSRHQAEKTAATRDRLGLASAIEAHEDDIVTLGKVNLRQQREIDAQRRRIKQLEDALHRAGGKIPEPNGE